MEANNLRWNLNNYFEIISFKITYNSEIVVDADDVYDDDEDDDDCGDYGD